MNKSVKLITALGMVVSCASLLAVNAHQSELKAEEIQTCFVDFFNNYLREEFTLSNGFNGKGNNIIYKTVAVPKDTYVSNPGTPTRRNYEFEGWYKEEACEHEWNFATDLVTKNTRLFAKWGLASAEEIVEPPYTPPSTVLDEAAAMDYIIDSIMYFPVNDNIVKLPTAGLSKLEANKNNVLPYLEYRVKAGLSITATYNEGFINITCNGNARSIQVKDDSLTYKLSNTTYESKAKKYEQAALEEQNYHVMLAGSSSIEFWTSSTEDLAPIVSYNHGIGGTTIEEWDECLNQRLVFPAKPKMVVYYVGINNVINSKQDASTIWTNLQKFFNDTHAALPNTKVQYIMMNLIPGYPTYYGVINSVNANVVNYQKNNSSWLTLINPGEALLKENGEPNAAYFRTDGLHLSFYGYVVWGGIIKESILRGLEAM